MRNNDAYLEDIRLASERMARYIEGMTLAEFLADDKTRAAVEREITITGEAAGRVSAEFKSAHADLPWARLVQLRNFYMHGYERLSPEEVWGTARRLAPQVERIIARLVQADDSKI